MHLIGIIIHNRDRCLLDFYMGLSNYDHSQSFHSLMAPKFQQDIHKEELYLIQSFQYFKTGSNSLHAASTASLRVKSGISIQDNLQLIANMHLLSEDLPSLSYVKSIGTCLTSKPDPGTFIPNFKTIPSFGCSLIIN